MSRITTDLLGSFVRFNDNAGEDLAKHRGQIRGVHLDSDGDPLYTIQLPTGRLNQFYAHSFEMEGGWGREKI